VDRVKGRDRYAAATRRAAVSAVLLGAVIAGGVVVSDRLPHVESRPAAGPTATGVTTPATPTAAPPTTTVAPAAPPIVRDPIPFGAKRKADTAAYLKRHAGKATWKLEPRMVVLHYSESDTYESVRSVFAANRPNLGERPGTCAHYVVDQVGVIRELVPPTTACRHTIGLNQEAIGVEFVQSSQGNSPRWATQQILSRRAQATAGAELVAWLERTYDIPPDRVIGHAMANDDKDFRDLVGWRNDHVDWQRPEVLRFRQLVADAG
jgi:hypothetical protein